MDRPPLLTAGLIQDGSPFDERMQDTIRAYVAPLREAGVDTVILGCTHYPLVSPMLQRMLGRGVHIVTSGTPVAHQVEHVLGARGLANPRAAEGRDGGASGDEGQPLVVAEAVGQRAQQPAREARHAAPGEQGARVDTHLHRDGTV